MLRVSCGIVLERRFVGLINLASVSVALNSETAALLLNSLWSVFTQYLNLGDVFVVQQHNNNNMLSNRW